MLCGDYLGGKDGVQKRETEAGESRGRRRELAARTPRRGRGRWSAGSGDSDKSAQGRSNCVRSGNSDGQRSCGRAGEQVEASAPEC